MQLDPNWFYSSLAQCAAAVVGLLGGVLVTRLQRQIVETQSFRVAFDNAKASAHPKLLGTRAVVEPYAIELGELVREIGAALAGTGPPLVSVRKHFAVRGGDIKYDNLAPSAEIRSQTVQRHEICLRYLDLISRCFDASTARDLEPLVREMEALRVEVGPGEEVLSDLPMALSQVGQAGRALEVAGSSQAPIVVLAVLSWLCVTSIVAPLYFLSAFSTMSKGCLLIAFAIGLGCLLAFIAHQIGELRRIAGTRVLWKVAPASE